MKWHRASAPQTLAGGTCSLQAGPPETEPAVETWEQGCPRNPGGTSRQVGQRDRVSPDAALTGCSVRFRGCWGSAGLGELGPRAGLCHLPDQSVGTLGEGVAFVEEGCSSEQTPPAAAGAGARVLKAGDRGPAEMRPSVTQTCTALPPSTGV